MISCNQSKNTALETIRLKETRGRAKGFNGETEARPDSSRNLETADCAWKTERSFAALRMAGKMSSERERDGNNYAYEPSTGQAEEELATSNHPCEASALSSAAKAR